MYEYALRLNTFLKTNNLIFEEQHDFQSSKSSNSAIHSFHSKMTAVMDSCPIAIFCDLSRSFDCVDHQLLIGQVELYWDSY